MPPGVCAWWGTSCEMNVPCWARWKVEVGGNPLGKARFQEVERGRFVDGDELLKELSRE